MRVWIVDDNVINCYVLKEMLSCNSFIEEIITYNVPSQVLDSLTTKSPPDIILTDIMMPGMDGYDLSKNVKHLFPDVRVIGITALPRTRDLIEEVQTCGMEHVIFKPYDMKTLEDYLTQNNAVKK